MPDQKVLVVEDEENLVEALRYNLEREGYAVLTAMDGEKGLELAKGSNPDLIILDVMLPKLDGFEVCRILRRDVNTPILMLTAKGEEVDRIVGLELAEAFNSMATSLRTTIHDLASERDKLSAVLDTMVDGVVVIGSEDQVDLLNAAGEALLGVGGSVTEGGRFMEVLRDYELQRLVSLCQETQQRQYGEVELLQRGRFLSCIATPLSGDGSPGVLLTLHDLTRVRQVETTRREFVSNVSHELRTPLDAVRVMAETLESGALEEKDVARDFVCRIQGEVDRMNSMVEDLLELARLEGGQDTLNLAPVDMVSLMEGARSQFQEQAEAKSIKVEVNAPEYLPGVLGDEEKLRQVLSNLLENALKFTWVEGEITLSARVEAGFVTVNVSDNGVGIPEEHLPHVFERFYKVDRSRRDGGTGLGLAIVKHIVQSHGGEAWVESRAGGGSSFSFRLPAAI